MRCVEQKALAYGVRNAEMKSGDSSRSASSSCRDDNREAVSDVSRFVVAILSLSAANASLAISTYSYFASGSGCEVL